MVYEAMVSGERVENIKAPNKLSALVVAQSRCEENERLVFLREKESAQMVWCYNVFMSP